MESENRIEKIVDYILANHDRKTHSKEFTGMMCVSSVDVLTKYYEIFKKKKHNLKIATIFSYSANEDDKDANGMYDLEESDGAHIDESHINRHSRDKLESYIQDYNAMFGSKFTTRDSQSFYNYYNDISKKVKNREIDILLVVNMFLTGFDSPSLNTLYVDKNLKYHGLVQAYSRTNRILGEKKSQGNIVCFRNLKKNTDEAIALFSNKDAKDIILMSSYETYVGRFNEDIEPLKAIAPTVASVDDLVDENQKAEFVVAFRALIRTKNILEGFSDFKWSDLNMSEQQFFDFLSKYLDLKPSPEIGNKVSILQDVDFELELIHKDEINVAYILRLLAKYIEASSPEEKAKQRANITNILNSNPQLRSKRELIEAFIDTTLEGIDPDDIEEEYDKFVEIEKEKAFNELIQKENLYGSELTKVIETYLYDGRKPLSDDIAKTLQVKPKLLERRTIIPRVLNAIENFVDKFYAAA